jgi:hypothetical protein
MEHGGMREVRVEGGGGHEHHVKVLRRVGGVMDDGGQGLKVIAGGSAQSPRLRSSETPILLRWKGRYFPRAMWWVFKRRWKGPLLAREKIGTKTKQMRNLEIRREMGMKFGRTDKAVEATKNAEQIDYNIVVGASTADVQDDYGKTSNKIRDGGV